MTETPDAARCRGCGYPLRQLATPRCPECGRPFDPADPTTMDLGRRPGWLGRLLLRPTGWPLAVAAVVGAALVVAATRSPAGGVRAVATDLLYYFADGWPRRGRLLSATDWAYVGGLGLAGLALLAWVVRAIGRPLAGRRYGRPPPPPHLGRRAALAAVAGVAAVVATGGVLVGWPYRLARVWARQLLAAVRQSAIANVYAPPVVVGPPLPMTDAQQLEVLKTGILRLPTTAERTACLRLLMEAGPRPTMPAVLVDLMRRQTDPAVRATLARLVGLHRDFATLDPLLAMWDDADADVRAAAVDAVGLLHAQAYPIPITQDEFSRSAEIAVDPPVGLAGLRLDTGQGVSGWRTHRTGEWTPLHVDDRLEPVRPRVVDRMVQGRSDAERQAAARALLRWQPGGYQLRVAEWGVWVADWSGKLALVQSLLDEIPPFVHRTSDTVASMAPRIDHIFAVDKPVLHVTADRPMVLDVQVLIARGRPWFAFPKPDDFTLSVSSPRGFGQSSPQSALAAFDRPALPPLGEAHEGYPWVDPPHRTHATWGTNDIVSLGLRWQSVIVSPRQLAWMMPPAVPADPAFAWWERLRRVDCSWVSSGGESDRFLYYDGPTAAAAPLRWTFDGRTLQFDRPAEADDGRGAWMGGRPFEPLVTSRRADQTRRGVFVRVAGGSVGGLAVDPVEFHTAVDTRRLSLAGEPAVAAALLAMLTAAGLTDGEAAGLVDCWRPQLFHTAGSRFLLLMTPADYDALCPLRIDPPPTELVRVGLVLTEFSDAAVSRPG